MRTRLFKLLDNLHLIAHEILFIYQIDVLKTLVIKNKVANIVDMDFTGLIQNAIARVIQILLRETPPLAVIKHHTMEVLKLFPNIGQHRRLWFYGYKFIALIPQVLNQFSFQVRFALVAVACWLSFDVLIKDDKVIGFSNGVCLMSHSASFVPSGKGRKGVKGDFRHVKNSLYTDRMLRWPGR